MGYRQVLLAFGLLTPVFAGACAPSPVETQTPSQTTAARAYATFEQNCNPTSPERSAKLREALSELSGKDIATLADQGILVCMNPALETQTVPFMVGQYIGAMFHASDRTVSLNGKYTIGGRSKMLAKLANGLRSGKITGKEDLYISPSSFSNGMYGIEWEKADGLHKHTVAANPKLKEAPTRK